MERIEKLNSSINYIEDYLTDEIDYEELGRISGCSSYHYQRMFTYLAGTSLSEYIRRRKMSLAAVDIQNGKERIIDVAENIDIIPLLLLTELFKLFIVWRHQWSETKVYQ